MMLDYLQSDIVQIPANIFDVDIVVECNPASSVESFILGMTEKSIYSSIYGIVP